ncbi:MAG: hypothetical protein WA417_01150 [Stellaceae bacterium]
MRCVTKSAAFACGLLLVGALGAQAQTTYYPSPYWQNYPAYSYAYGYPGYGSYYTSPYQSYLGYPYPAPLAFWDPYVWYRPYSDNAGPKASGHGGF